jgi:hypothetical protein
VLGVVLTCISLEIPDEKIVKGIKNYKGIPGRTNKRVIENSTIIEEINPGINTQAIKESVNNYCISVVENLRKLLVGKNNVVGHNVVLFACYFYIIGLFCLTSSRFASPRYRNPPSVG